MSKINQPIQAIIFDFDGVLFDSETLHFEALNQVLQPLGFTVSHDVYLQKYVGLTDSSMFPLILSAQGLGLTDSEVQQLIHTKIKTYKDAVYQHPSLPGITGISAFLKKAAQSIEFFGICSNGSHTEVHTVLDRLEGGQLKGYFQKVTTREEVAQGKPSPEGYLKTADFLGVDPTHCVVIEDTQHGLQAAKSAGMQAIGITTTHDASALTTADYVARDYADIQKWLLDEF